MAVNDTDFSVSNCATCTLAKSKQQNHPTVALIEVIASRVSVHKTIRNYKLSILSRQYSMWPHSLTNPNKPKVGVLSQHEKQGYSFNELHPTRGDSMLASTSTFSLGPWGRVPRSGLSRVLPKDRNQAGNFGNEYTTERDFRR